MDIKRLSRQTCRFLRPPGVVSWANGGAAADGALHPALVVLLLVAGCVQVVGNQAEAAS